MRLLRNNLIHEKPEKDGEPVTLWWFAIPLLVDRYLFWFCSIPIVQNYYMKKF